MFLHIIVTATKSMPDDPTSPNRRSVRLPGFDYSRIGQYFVTICTHEKRNFFVSITKPHIILDTAGRIAQFYWIKIPNHFAAVRLSEFIVMPNHIHGILTITNSPRDATLPESSHREAFGNPNPHSLATIIRSYKSQVSNELRTFQKTPNFTLWQRGFYEHILRNATDYSNAARYIRQNPERFANVQPSVPKNDLFNH